MQGWAARLGCALVGLTLGTGVQAEGALSTDTVTLSPGPPTVTIAPAAISSPLPLTVRIEATFPSGLGSIRAILATFNGEDVTALLAPFVTELSAAAGAIVVPGVAFPVGTQAIFVFTLETTAGGASAVLFIDVQPAPELDLVPATQVIGAGMPATFTATGCDLDCVWGPMPFAGGLLQPNRNQATVVAGSQPGTFAIEVSAGGAVAAGSFEVREVCATGCAASSACAGHGGVHCSAGPDGDGSVICNDGYRDSGTPYGCGSGPPPLSITTRRLPASTVGLSYSAALAASGGTPPYTWSLVGDPPPGIAFNSSTATFHGSSTGSGVFSLTAQVSDAQSASSSRVLQIAINAVPSGPGWSAYALGGSDTLYGLDFVADSGWIAGANQALLHSSDGGLSWVPQAADFWSATNPSGEASAHVISPAPDWGDYHLVGLRMAGAANIWVSSIGPHQLPDPGYGSEALSACFVSSNGGATWTRVILATNFQIWGISGLDGSSARAASVAHPSHLDSDIFTIEAQRDQSRTPRTFGALYDIQMLGGTVGYAAGATVFKTSDGIHWNPTLAPSGQYRAVFFHDAERGWVVGDGGRILHTSNGGASWTSQVSGTSADLWGVSFADGTSGWAVGFGGTILRSSDGGEHWSPEPSGTSSDLYDVKARSATEAWAAGSGGTLLRRQ
ncbi:MAG TPA: YCF48-related protein [Acidobacteriota bacterium]